jgi:hypothetical protein
MFAVEQPDILTSMDVKVPSLRMLPISPEVGHSAIRIHSTPFNANHPPRSGAGSATDCLTDITNLPHVTAAEIPELCVCSR